ncbi:hypothetical protein N0V91_007654 [Didymella pomorum]|uniref:Carbohydrate esterase family 5 protein n=1 Tax=Didymella pomorum TaxID=749634 RepID=A0A9W8Z8Q5_9PLEO|nr:hypothetical protein N0V91_007654 [Didymella pomorum]
MSFIRQTLAIGALSALAAAQTTAPKLDATCADVVIFMARGNDAPYNDGRTSPLRDTTCAKLTAQGKTCDYIEVQYDVTLGADYCTQVAEGARNGIAQVTAFNQKCPCSHIVINGYSEGAHVMGDVLGGPGGCTKVSNGIDNTSSAGKAIAAALLWGNVMHTANQPYNVLDGASKQANPRSAADLALLNRYTPVLRDYCAAGDPVCAGGSVVADHLNYFELYTEEASSWIVGKIDAAAPLCAAPSSSSVVPATSSTAAPFSSAAPSASKEATPSASAPGTPSAVYPTGGYPTAAYPTGSAPTTMVTYTATYPTSVATPSPFPEPSQYEEACIVVYDVEYVYA